MPHLTPPLELKQPYSKEACFLAIDPGQKRIGLAVGNRITLSATPLTSIHAQGKNRWDLLHPIIQEWKPEALVIGVPFYPDGAVHEGTQMAQNWAKYLRQRYLIPVIEVDERYSTTEALRWKTQDVDAASACVILEQFLRSLS